MTEGREHALTCPETVPIAQDAAHAHFRPGSSEDVDYIGVQNPLRRVTGALVNFGYPSERHDWC